MRFVRWWSLWLNLLPLWAAAQLQLSHPTARFVAQRSTDGTGRLYVAGRFSGTIDRVEAQLTPAVSGQGTATAWQLVQLNPTNNIFLGYVTGAGGWYTLTVRTVLNNTVVEQTTLQPVGIGEVFVTAGQSNSRGLGIGDNDLGTNTDRVNAIDSINHYYPPGAQALYSSGDPPPVPVYKALKATQRVFPMAESSWGWGELGDYIVSRYNVPVTFYVTGWDASTVDNWASTANGNPTCNRYYCVENWPNLQPYTNLKNILQYYLSVSGARSVLWHQGEAEYGDASSGSIPNYVNNLKTVIQKSRQDFGGQNLPWMVARASYDGQTTRPDVINAQQQVINTAGLNVFQGPYNDTIQYRNAGSNDVHFRNASRPSPHPAYYANANAIPQNMGLSRFARNWNNSLNASFFQNAAPITPTQFAATGNLASVIPPGSTITVSFATVGTFNSGNQWQVQLLDSVGHYLSVLGSGASSPIQVTLPSSLTTGHFQVRVVSSSPALPAAPSNLFRISTIADVRLAMSVSQRTTTLNAPISVNIFVTNDGPNSATNLLVRDRLPANLSFVSSSDFTATNGVLTSAAAFSLSAGSTQVFSFLAQPVAGGTYQNSAEIAQASVFDPDSQPNSGTGDGQDDATTADFRTTEGGGQYVSPNPNQVPLPAVVSNQPIPDATTADVSISLAVSSRTPKVNDVLTYTLTIANRGGAAAMGTQVTAYLPAGQTLIAGDDFGTAGVSSTNDLSAGSTLTLRFRTRVTATGTAITKAEITACSTTDPDSTPGNGTTNGEDDTAQVDIRAQ